MSLIPKLGRSRFGKWLRNRAGGPGLGRPLRAAVRLAKRAERGVVRLSAEHRAHDRAQAATLAGFERDTVRRQSRGVASK